MEWVNSLNGHVVGLDTAPIIYFIEAHPAYLPIVLPFFQAADRDEIHVVTSTVSITEVLVRPYRTGDIELARRYQDIISNSRGITCFSVSEAIAEQAARLRAEYALRTPDALQMATAIVHGATSFLTNDSKLQNISNLRIILLSDL